MANTNPKSFALKGPIHIQDSSGKKIDIDDIGLFVMPAFNDFESEVHKVLRSDFNFSIEFALQSVSIPFKVMIIPEKHPEQNNLSGLNEVANWPNGKKACTIQLIEGPPDVLPLMKAYIEGLLANETSS